VPSLDLRFAESKSLVDSVSGQNLITFTRSSTGTFVDSDGVIRSATTNLLLRSEEFNDAYWSKVDASVSADAIVSPSGAASADRLVDTTSNSLHYAIRAVTVAANTAHTYSIYAKAGEYSRCRIRFGKNGSPFTRIGIIVNLNDGTITNSDVGTPTSVAVRSAVNVGGGWYRISVGGVFDTTSTDGYIEATLVDDLGNASFTGTGTSGIFIWGAQLEQSSTVGPYIPTTSTINSAPRFDHNPLTGECLGLLPEEQRQNLLLRSEEFDNASWTKVGGTIALNSIASPSGTTTADALVEDTSTGTHRCLQAPTIVNATIYTISVYAKAAGRTHVRLNGGSGLAGDVIANLSNGTVASSSGATNPTVQAVGNGWYRVSFTTAASTSTTAQVTVQLVQGTSTTSYTGDGTSGIFLWGAQLEAGSGPPSSYIPTTGTAATRTADVVSCSGTNFSSWYRQDEGAFYVESRQSANVLGFMFAASDGTDNNRIAQFRNTTALSSRHAVAGAAANPGDISISPLSLVKSALAASGGSSVAAANGALSSAGSPAAMPVVDRLFIGAGAAGLTHLNGPIRRLTFWPTRLPNSTLQSITQ
jgi:hypothetical protein